MTKPNPWPLYIAVLVVFGVILGCKMAQETQKIERKMPVANINPRMAVAPSVPQEDVAPVPVKIIDTLVWDWLNGGQVVRDYPRAMSGCRVEFGVDYRTNLIKGSWQRVGVSWSNVFRLPDNLTNLPSAAFRVEVHLKPKLYK